MCEVALQVESSSLSRVKTNPEMWKLACEQYEVFAPGIYEWPALLRRCDRLDPSYKK